VYLNIDQALEDYAVIITSLQQEYNLTGSNAVPWIAVGGSYGGVLSAFIRVRYPNLISGAIAASAPIKYISNQVDYSFFAAATQDYSNYDASCVTNIRSAYAALESMISAAQYQDIAKAMNLCAVPVGPGQPPGPNQPTTEHVLLWTVNSLLSLAQFDYPYPTNFEAPLPGFPVNTACDIMSNATGVSDPFELVALLGQAAGLFYNGTGGGLTCFDTLSEFVECADQTGCGTGPDGTAWDIQVCSQFVYLPSTNNQVRR
jgi:dipeptidyl-peptidase-2